MRCPACGRESVVGYRTGKRVCASCGWGTESFSPEGARKNRRVSRAHRADVSVVALAVQWLVAAAVVAGLYWIVFEAARAQRSVGNILFFALAVAVYAAAGWVLRPSVDPEKLGMFGNMLIDNPLTYRDDIERFKLWLLIACFPGRIISGAVVCLVRFLRDRCWSS